MFFDPLLGEKMLAMWPIEHDFLSSVEDENSAILGSKKNRRNDRRCFVFVALIL